MRDGAASLAESFQLAQLVKLKRSKRNGRSNCLVRQFAPTVARYAHYSFALLLRERESCNVES